MPPAEKLHVLFVCTMNQWRSPTAEYLYRNDPRLAVRSAGLSPTARHVLSAKDIAWADLIFVMERTHARRLADQFPDHPQIINLDVPNDLPYMDPELQKILRAGIDSELEIFFNSSSA